VPYNCPAGKHSEYPLKLHSDMSEVQTWKTQTQTADAAARQAIATAAIARDIAKVTAKSVKSASCSHYLSVSSMSKS
jgi:hypothetical protein